MTSEERAKLARLHPELADIVTLAQEHLRRRSVFLYEEKRYVERVGAGEDRDCGKRDYEAAKASESEGAKALSLAIKRIWGCKRSVPSVGRT